MKQYLLITMTSLLAGITFFMYQQGWIVLNLPKVNGSYTLFKQDKNKLIKKNINLFFWQNEKWHKESTEIIWSDSISQNCFIIVSNWLNILDEEKIIDKKISLQNALSSSNEQEIYLSFDRVLFNDESSTFDKLMLIESLLKTLRDNDIEIKKVNFLVHNQEMRDNHLDFSHSWTITGFTN